ncbi:MAG: PQQ-binding-like beta-propeller repeat protein [Chloroflexota bacterium]
MFQMNAQHTGLTPYAGPRAPVLLRSFQLPAPTEATHPPVDVQSEAAIGPDGIIYIGSHAGVMVALRDPGSGSELSLVWQFHPAGASSWHTTPAIAQDGTVYAGFSTGALTPDARGTFYALHAPAAGATTPQVAWSYDFGPASGRQTSSPTIGPDGAIYAVSGVGKLYVLRPDGKLQWSAPTGPNIQAAPALGADGTVYLASVDGKLYAVRPPAAGAGDGSIRWTFDFGQHLGAMPFPTAAGPYPSKEPFGANGIGTLASPTIGPDGSIYVGADNSNMYAVTPDGQMKWLYEAERELAGIASTAALSADGSTLYFGANKGGIYALGAADGKRRWQFNVYGSIDPSPTIDKNGTLYTGSTIGHMFGLDAASGRQIFDYDAGGTVWTAPGILPNGTMVVATRKGKVMVLGDK